MAPEPSLTFTQFGVLFNVVGIAIALVVSLAIARGYPRPFFRSWTWHFVYTFPSVVFSLVPAPPRWLVVLQAVAYLLATYYLVQTVLDLKGRPAPRWHGPVRLGVGLLALGPVLAGQPFEVAAVLPLLICIGAQFMLGFHLMGLGSRPAAGLGGLLWAFNFWLLAYPVMVNSPFGWLGYAVSGLFQIFMGVGMAVYLLDDAAEQVRRQHEALQEVDRLKTNFLATMSHELRTPLTVILGNGLLLRDGSAGALTSHQAPLVADLCDQGERLVSLIDDLLDFSRMEVGAMRYHLAAENLNELVAGTVEGLRTSLEREGLALEVVVPESPLVAPVDGLKVAQVLVNLLTNAAKFTRAGCIIVTLEALGDTARVSVADTGIGIAEPEQSRVFEKFYQVDGSSTRQAGGTGLGLAICKAIVEEGHGGRIWVESTPGAGSTFRFTVPLTPP